MVLGQSVRRKEDQRFITGKGRYVNDVEKPNALHVAFVRSPHAHARIASIDVSAARAASSVAVVLTGEDWALSGLGNPMSAWTVTSQNGERMKEPQRPALAKDRVRYVGEIVAAVIAETELAAKDASELVAIEYEPLPAIVSPLKALDQSATLVHEEISNNLSFDWAAGDAAAVDAAFEKAAHRVELTLSNNRVVPTPIEPRAALAELDTGTGEYTVYTASQVPHAVRLVLALYVRVAPEHKIRVISPDVGGGFGGKMSVYPEEIVCTWAAGLLKRPVRWVAERAEALLSDTHARDHPETIAELALDAEGNFLALRVTTIGNMGCYLTAGGPACPTAVFAMGLAGQYRTPAIHVRSRGVFTNTAPTDAYRGAGQPEAHFLLERLVDIAAREMKIDPIELRRRNLIKPEDFPYATPQGLHSYDSGNYPALLEKAAELADVTGFESRKSQSETSGKRRGLGVACYTEVAGPGPSKLFISLGAGGGAYESAGLRVNPSGSITVFSGNHNQGQGHETTFAQIVADRFGISVDDIDVINGDTGRVQYGNGTHGSRSAAIGGSAVLAATDKIIAKGKKIVAHIFETSEDKVDFDAGQFKVSGTNQSMSFHEVAFAAYVPANYPIDEVEPGLEVSAFYEPKAPTTPAGTFICEVEVDPETGAVRLDRFTAVDDFGRIINPMIVEGQVHGGLAQGFGQALLEEALYDSESGQLLTGSLMDYCLPRAEDLPTFALAFNETPSPVNRLGVKGCGEAGAIGGPPAIINAITNAIGVKHMNMPATSERVWRALNSTESKI